MEKVVAHWMGVELAASVRTLVVEGNHYFPRDDVDLTKLVESPRRTTCPIKGEAHYFDIRISDVSNEEAAWTYPDPKPVAAAIRNYIAFWKGVEVG